MNFLRTTAIMLSVATTFLGVASAQIKPARVIVVVGPPGSGKTTQAKYIARKYGIPAFSMSDLLKAKMGGKNDAFSKSLGADIESGELLPDEAANELMRSHLIRADLKKGFVLDGYPASPAQAEALDGILDNHHLTKPVVVVLDAPDDVIRNRMIKRQRADDKPENIDRRIREFRDQSSLLAEWWGRTNFVRVNAVGSVSQVSSQILTGVEEALSKRAFKVRP